MRRCADKGDVQMKINVQMSKCADVQMKGCAVGFEDVLTGTCRIAILDQIYVLNWHICTFEIRTSAHLLPQHNVFQRIIK